MKKLLLVALLGLAGCSVDFNAKAHWPEARTAKGGAFGDPRETRKNELKYSSDFKVSPVSRTQQDRRSMNYYGK